MGSGVIFGDKDQYVYCGITKDDDDKLKLTWDHLVPITPPSSCKYCCDDHGRSKIGHSVKGNLVLACLSCNSSKKNTHFECWMKSEKPKNPPRIKRGLDFVEKQIVKLECYIKEMDPDIESKEEKLHKAKSVIQQRKKISQLRCDLKKELECLHEYTKGIIG